MKIRDIAPFGLRMPPDLREAIQREATINSRSLSSEILDRLRKSLIDERHLRAESPGAPSYVAHTDAERAMIAVFRRMPAEKQLALLSLFK